MTEEWNSECDRRGPQKEVNELNVGEILLIINPSGPNDGDSGSTPTEEPGWQGDDFRCAG